MEKPIRILHLEDNDLDAELVTHALERGGLAFESTRVQTRDDFTSALRGCGYDIIIADYMLPAFDGVMALEIAMDICPDIPYIFVSGQLGEEVAVEALKKGATDYVVKDRLSRLAQSVTRALHEAEEHRERRRAEEGLKKLNRVYAFLSEVNQLIVRTKDRQTLFDGACRIAVEKGLFPMAWVGLADETARAVRPVASAGLVDGYLDNLAVSIDDIPKGAGPTGTAVRTAMHSINHDTEDNPSMRPWRDEALRRGYLSSAAFPLVVEGKAVGVVTVYASEPHFFDDEEVRLLDELAMNISYSLWIMEMEERRRRAEAEARELDEKLRALVEDALVGVYIIQGDRYVYCNKQIAQMLGYSKEEMLGLKTVLNAVHPDDRDLVRENLRKRLDGEVKGMRYELRMLKKDGGHIPVEAFGSLTVYQGQLSVIGTLLDITERKELERQRSNFYAMVTHDIKSPLTSILGYSELMLTDKPDKLDAGVKSMVRAINDSGEKLLRIVEDFLTLSKMQSGTFTLEVKPADMSRIVLDAQKELDVVCKTKKLTCGVRIEDGLPEVMMDPWLMQRAVLNLLGNAVKYTPGGGSITLEAGSITEEAGRFIIISVSDTGPGIPAEEHAKIFDSYYRSPGTAGLKGTGLGLSIVKAVAEAHGGRVEVESEVGEGSTFRLFIPLKGVGKQAGPDRFFLDIKN
ncbi:MAG: ATP-binding protein [Nitrospirota bacterium]